MEKMTDTPACRDAISLSEPPPEIDATLSVLGGKWKMLILWQLLRRSCRFNELRRAITVAEAYRAVENNDTAGKIVVELLHG
jgi:DNA-binding HxlR family transcriptional regulator